MHFVSPNTSM